VEELEKLSNRASQAFSRRNKNQLRRRLRK
jgi:hypothetical protein